ncbi:MAG: hypothetical protein HC924_17440 [Synechococcaceae cyanobacterium SM2_3_2]|nr:hypothetical protein [Synechococcaceae cyanobacterium SM2_3_2]
MDPVKSIAGHSAQKIDERRLKKSALSILLKGLFLIAPLHVIATFPEPVEAQQCQNRQNGICLSVPTLQLPQNSDVPTRIRAVNDWAFRNGSTVAFPNFHQADYGNGLVFGVHVLDGTMAASVDVPISQLGNPRTVEDQFRAVNDWASRNHNSVAFPNFHQANYGSGTVAGVVLLDNRIARSIDVPMSELGNPRTVEERFRAVNEWATINGYSAAFS